MGHNPLFIGACILTHLLRTVQRKKYVSQSPLHRGLYSDCRPRPRSTYERPSHNPLFIGACILTWFRLYCTTIWKGHNPLFIGACILTVPTSAVQPPTPSHNPLFIGACILTDDAAMLSSQDGSHNPLFIGACILTESPRSPARRQPKSQSPLHRGLYSD